MDSSVEKGSGSLDPDGRTASGEPKACTDCYTTKTPLWRGGPFGPKSLCNACGIRYRKKRREALGLDGPKRRESVAAAAGSCPDNDGGEEEEQQKPRKTKGKRVGAGGGDGGAAHGGVRQGGGAEAAAADAAQEAPRRGGEGRHPAHGPLLRRHLRLLSPLLVPADPACSKPAREDRR